MKFGIKYLLLCIIFGLFGHYWPELMYVVIWDNFHEYWIRWILWELILNDWNYFVRGLLNLLNIWFDLVFNVNEYGFINFDFVCWLGGWDKFLKSCNMRWLCDFKKKGEVRILWIYCILLKKWWWRRYIYNTKIINQPKMIWSNFRPFLLDVY